MINTNAGFLRRFFATITDSLLSLSVIALCYLIFASIVSGKEIVSLVVNGVTVLFTYYAIVPVLIVLINAYLIAHFGGTIGKLLFGIRIVDYTTNEHISMKTALWRMTAGYAFSGVLLCLGFWRIISNPEKLGYHDDLFNTKVVKVASPAAGVLSLLILPIFVGLALFLGTVTLVNKVKLDQTKVDFMNTSNSNTFQF
jgi:uncharacterized RDD family membrane protein YckC